MGQAAFGILSGAQNFSGRQQAAFYGRTDAFTQINGSKTRGISNQVAPPSLNLAVI